MYRGLLLLSCTLLVMIGTSQSQTYGIAKFNMRGIQGTIKFMPNDNNIVNITVDIQGTTMNHSWHVHNFPVETSLPPQTRCSNDNIGGHFDPLGAKAALGSLYSTYCGLNNQTACEVGDLSGKVGSLTSGTFNYIDKSGDLTLFGRYGIIGRSIKIHGTEDVCATIYSSTEVMNRKFHVTTLQASFTYPVGGTIYMRQVAGEESVIFGKLFWVTNSQTTMNHKWHVHLNQPSMRYREGNCSDVGGHFNPYSVNTSAPSYAYCGPTNLTKCEVGDLSGKHGKITISENPSPYNQYGFLYHDSFLNLTGMNAVMGRSIAIHSNVGATPIMACAPLVEVETLTVTTISEMFSASQSSSYSPTYINTAYNAEEFTIFDSAIAPNQFCQVTFSAGRPRIYNPHSAPSLDGSDNTPDRYPVGQISTKYNFSSETRVSELPIHGIETVAGRSLGQTRQSSPSSTQFLCASLWPSYPGVESSNIKMAKATFDNVVSGAIYFIQRTFGRGVFGVTYILVDLWYTDNNRATSEGHKWHIHVNPPIAGKMCRGTIGGHFNPFNVNVSSSENYTTECSPITPLRCESGDLSGKHPRLQISPGIASRTSYTYVDSNLHLWGANDYSIIGRSVGLHLPASEGGALFDCGEIQEVYYASNALNLILSYDVNFDRTNFATRITDIVTDATPSDILIVQQTMTVDSSSRTGNVNMTVRVLGNSTANANTKAIAVQARFNEIYSSTALILPSFFSIICLLVLAIFIGLP